MGLVTVKDVTISSVYFDDFSCSHRCHWLYKLRYRLLIEVANITQCALVFLIYTKSSEDESFFPTYYDAKQVRISQEKHLLVGFPLSY